MLKVKNLSKKINGNPILNNLSFEIDHGNIAIFLGGSGAGKSTLLRVLNNLELYDSGSIILDGSPLGKNIGIVFQNFNLFEHLNAEDNIIATLVHCKKMKRKEAMRIAHALLCRYGLLEKAKSSVHTLSGGQKQRLAIARSLAVDPKIICLDEPTSALDPRLTSQVARLIAELAAENRIVLLTTHDTNLVEQLEGHLYLMEKGAIIEKSSRKESAFNAGIQLFMKG